MTNLAQLGVLYIYIILVILVLSLGYVFYRILCWFAEFAKEPNASKVDTKNKFKTIPAKNPFFHGWTRVVFVSAVVLFLSVFSVGVLKTVGGGAAEHDHNHQSGASTDAAQSPVATSGNMQQPVAVTQVQQYQSTQQMQQPLQIQPNYRPQTGYYGYVYYPYQYQYQNPNPSYYQYQYPY